MGSYIFFAMQIVAYLAENKAAIKQLILDIEELIPDEAGSAKANVVKSFIAKSLDAEAVIEDVWPYIAPLFNALVGYVKKNVTKQPFTGEN